MSSALHTAVACRVAAARDQLRYNSWRLLLLLLLRRSSRKPGARAPGGEGAPRPSLIQLDLRSSIHVAQIIDSYTAAACPVTKVGLRIEEKIYILPILEIRAEGCQGEIEYRIDPFPTKPPDSAGMRVLLENGSSR